MFNKLSIIENENLITIKNSINVCLAEQLVDLKYWAYVFKTESERDYLIKLGEKQGEQFVTMLMSLNTNESVNANGESVNTNDESINEVVIYNINGALINQYQINNQHALIDIQMLSAGIYFIQANCNSKTDHFKLIKQ